jgi:lipoate-protein ligase A
MLRCLQRKETDPYFNIAAEEFLLLNAVTDTFSIWRNEQSIIIGKHQNANREINHNLVNHYRIPVIRRITGGGTVYHDPGNVNFSFIRLNRKENPVDFKFFTKPIITFLQHLGLKAEFEGKSNITVNGLKVSGNSAHVFKGRVLHHGTLLFEADKDLLGKSLQPLDESYSDKSVRSIHKNVLNLADEIHAEMTVNDFMEAFFSFIINYYRDAYQDSLSEDEYNEIEKLAREKYRSTEWNIGYSPDYQYTKSWRSFNDDYHLKLTVKEGIIDVIQIHGPKEHQAVYREIENALQGSLHDINSISARLKKLNFASQHSNGIVKQILEHIF